MTCLILILKDQDLTTLFLILLLYQTTQVIIMLTKWWKTHKWNKNSCHTGELTCPFLFTIFSQQHSFSHSSVNGLYCFPCGWLVKRSACWCELVRQIVSRSCPGSRADHHGCHSCSVSGPVVRVDRLACLATWRIYTLKWIFFKGIFSPVCPNNLFIKLFINLLVIQLFLQIFWLTPFWYTARGAEEKLKAKDDSFMKTDDKVELFLTESINGHAKKTKNRKRLWTAKTHKKGC